jgi:hypothetical protein
VDDLTDPLLIVATGIVVWIVGLAALGIWALG